MTTPAENIARALGITRAEYEAFREERIGRVVAALDHLIRRHKAHNDPKLSRLMGDHLKLATAHTPTLEADAAAGADVREIFRRTVAAVAAVAEDGAQPESLADQARALQADLAAYLAYNTCERTRALVEGLDRPCKLGA